MEELEVSVVMPCLNEAATVGICVEKALRTLEKLGIKGEVVVSDNGSKDGSPEIALQAGARVVQGSIKGYGNAYRQGFLEAKGKYIIMADADDSYDFTDLERFILPLREGYDMVMGTRMKGEIKEGAMPALHRYLGVPVLTWMLNLLYHSGLSDAHCGMRSFTREALERMHLSSPGMEFASEMIIRATQAGLRIKEIPITLYPDGRPGKPHLKSFSDGWRHIRYMLNHKPGFLYSLPGWILLMFGLILLFTNTILMMVREEEGLYRLNWSLFASGLAVCGYFILILGIISAARNYTGKFPASEKYIEKYYRGFNSGSIIWKGVFATIIGLILIISFWNSAFNAVVNFGVWGLTLMVMGLTTVFSAFILGQMNIYGRE